MSDARWFEIEAAVAAAVRHFAGASTIFAQIPGAADRYLVEMAFMHAMLAGQTSLETALLRILELYGEEAPTGSRWHADLVRRAANAVGSRPPVLEGEVAAAADETRRFRSVSAHAYDSFDHTRATKAVEGAVLLATRLASEIARFRQISDP
jgi:FAD/FMN-containing dehydrogenase